jgi:hypothetical protein
MAYDRETAHRICALIAEGQTLDSICEQDGMPAASTFRGWVMDDIDGLGAVSARAYEMGCHAIAGQAMAIADDGRNDWMRDNDPDNPGYKLNGEHVQRSKLRIETRMRLIGKWLKKVYGDHQQVEHDVPKDGPLHALLQQMGKSSMPVVQAPDDE